MGKPCEQRVSPSAAVLGEQEFLRKTAPASAEMQVTVMAPTSYFRAGRVRKYATQTASPRVERRPASLERLNARNAPARSAA